MDDMLKRPVRQSMDGLNEVQFGIVFLLWGSISLILKLWGSGLPEWMSWSWLIVLPAAFYLRPLTNRLRARWVAPRIGYVKVPPPIMGKPVIAMIVGGIIGFVFVISWVQSLHFRLSLPTDLGLIFAAANFILWSRLRIRRFLIYAILALAAGLAVQWIVPESIGSEAFLCLLSVLYLVGGSLVLRQLMRLPIAVEDSL